jgi:hypothetical protein
MLEDKVIKYMNAVLESNGIHEVEQLGPDSASGGFEYYRGQATNKLGQKLIIEVGAAGLDSIKLSAETQKKIPDIPKLLKFDYRASLCDEDEMPRVQFYIKDGRVSGGIEVQSGSLANEFKYEGNITYKWAFKKLVKIFAQESRID